MYYDTETNLEWLNVRDTDTTFDDAEKLIKALHNGWRMPTLAELRTLYKKGIGSRNMPSEIKNTGWFVWSCQVDCVDGFEQDYVWGLKFSSGGTTGSLCGSSDGKRALAVRPRK